ncbi:hypothetical protein FRC04_002814 [Tulasnella sp. 424]|nr:hypothetical protein FRC04_002814 [Tulasnella sp. 424]KAG8966624.1 hypothetical protein FRC05_002503 [Tulasnella sp. 425]
MATVSPPTRTNYKSLVNSHRQAKAKIPDSVLNLIRNQIVVVQYEKGLLWKRESDVVKDLAQALPNIEFIVFLSDFDEIPLAKSLRASHKTLASALLAASASIRYRTNFICRPVHLHEKLAVSDMVTGYIQPFEGASLVLERDREAIDAYEAQYEEAVRDYRSAQSKEPISPVKSAISSTHADDAVDGEEEGATDSGMLTAEGVEGVEGSQFHYKEKKDHGSISHKRKSGEEGDQEANKDSGPSLSLASTPINHPMKRQRKRTKTLEPITSEDRDKWIGHVALASREARASHHDMLKEFLSTTGRDRGWTIQQWNTYLKQNKSYITHQIDMRCPPM